MSIPLMIESLVFVPKGISFLGLIGLLVAGIMEFRQGHIGRLGIAANVFFLWQIFFPVWLMLPGWFQFYLNLGTIATIVAIPSYLFRFSLPTQFYQIAFIGYGSISVILAIILSLQLAV